MAFNHKRVAAEEVDQEAADLNEDPAEETLEAAPRAPTKDPRVRPMCICCCRNGGPYSFLPDPLPYKVGGSFTIRLGSVDTGAKEYDNFVASHAHRVKSQAR
ncbi:hypothetical protein VNO77_19406 [Canavalia gladiata]|uniref:Uncharacterized protein n=1 Tax=Canavalia gladiata TaxID=3824 RepID=A0AAN9LMF7_CANGL